MIRMRKPTLALVAASFMGFSALAMAHHGWTGYQTELLKVDGVIEQSAFVNPHGTIQLKTPEKTWLVVLAPTSRMANRGLTAEMLKTGITVTVEGYQKTADPQEMRAERITVDGKTVELR
ncbi:MAG: DUF6152 family protein [Steroidobacter sp.]